MAVYEYEKFIGYNKRELKYKKQMVIDKVSGNEVEDYVERTPEEVEAYKNQKELEFRQIKANWERLGIKKCAWERSFDEKKFSQIYRNLIGERLSELSSQNPVDNIETNMLNSINDVEKKYNIGVALNYYSVKEDNYFSPDKIFKGVSKSKMEKMFYGSISTQSAIALARNRLSSATTLTEGVALLQELQKTHNSRSIFHKIFHPFKNAEENRLIKEVKAEVMQKFNVSQNVLNAKMQRKIDKSALKTANLYKLDDFVNTYCKESAGKIYSQRQIDMDRQDVAQRADDDFVKSQQELNRIIEDEAREPIIVEDAKNIDEMEKSVESVREDPLIIKVPNNDKL